MSKPPPSARRPAAGDEAALHARIQALVLAARQTVARGVDLVQVRTNFEIGRHIVEPRHDVGIRRVRREPEMHCGVSGHFHVGRQARRFVRQDVLAGGLSRTGG